MGGPCYYIVKKSYIMKLYKDFMNKKKSYSLLYSVIN